MKSKQLNNNIKNKTIPITRRLNTESKLYLYNETLIKIYKSNVNLDDKRRILDTISSFDIKGCLIPDFALYEKDTLCGIQMNYLFDYDSIYNIINNENLDFKIRRDIAFKICQIILAIERKNTIYQDIHEDNILINNKDIKIIDMDNILLPYKFNKYEYEIERLESRRRLIYLCMQLLLNRCNLNITNINESKIKAVYTLSNQKQKELYDFAFLDKDNEINPLDYLSYFNEGYIECIKKILYLR